jgi:exopolysaccharide biosynthesis polyprenyl glycosylphosphotransferase
MRRPFHVPRRSIPLPSLRLRWSERRLLLFVADVTLLEGALLASLLLRTDFIRSLRDVAALWRWILTLAVVWLAVAHFFDCYNLARAASTTYSTVSGASAAAATAIVYTFIPVLSPPLQSRLQIVIFAGVSVAGVAGWRALYALLFAQPWFKQRVLVVGAGLAGRTLVAALRQSPHDANPFRGTGYQVVGFIDDDARMLGREVEGVAVLGDRSRLLNLAQTLAVDEIVLAITHRNAIADELFDALLACREQGFRVTTMGVLYERLLGRVPVYHVGRDLHMVVPMEDAPLERLYRVGKRLTDLGFGVAALIAVGLLTPPVALVNALTSPGPLFYRQARVGRGGRIFSMLKFRSMVPDAEASSGAIWAAKRDPRVTPVGRFLRRLRLDELPQAVNVLRGEMSLIGPRPERPEFVSHLAETVPFYRLRHTVRPGITGWAQVCYRYGNSEEDAVIKLEYDLYYIKHASLWLDLRIALLTVPVMLTGRGS